MELQPLLQIWFSHVQESPNPLPSCLFYVSFSSLPNTCVDLRCNHIHDNYRQLARAVYKKSRTFGHSNSVWFHNEPWYVTQCKKIIGILWIFKVQLYIASTYHIFFTSCDILFSLLLSRNISCKNPKHLQWLFIFVKFWLWIYQSLHKLLHEYCQNRAISQL